MMAQGPVIRDDAVMVTCARCGTENESGNRFCQSCGSALGADARSGPTVMLDEPPPAIPEWVIPSPVGTPPKAEPKIPRGRAAKFVLLLLVWLGVFFAAPAWGIWSTSTFLRDVGVAEYFHALPTCEDSAQAAGEDPALCGQPDVQSRYRAASQDVHDERRRALVFASISFGGLALATLVLVMAAGLRPWWALGVFVSPLNLVVWVWALWRVAAWPVRYWAPRGT
jgi:hypothetical protein